MKKRIKQRKPDLEQEKESGFFAPNFRKQGQCPGMNDMPQTAFYSKRLLKIGLWSVLS